MVRNAVAGAAHQVGPEMWVELAYAVFDADGERVDAPDDRASFVFGYGQLLPELERAIDGLSVGQTRSVNLGPSAAFGRRRKEAVLEVDRDEFPADVAAGDRFEAEGRDGAIVVLKVLELHDDCVVIDTNHPLSGQKVRFDFEVLAVRPATASEVQTALARLEATQPAAAQPLISPQSLRLGGARRYTNDPVAASAAGAEPRRATDPRSPERRNDS